MSVLTSYASQSARDSAAPAASNTGLCIFRSDTKAIEVSDGTNYLTYNNDGVAYSFPSNSYSGLFDGSNDYIQVSSSSSLSIGGSVTITAWIRKDTTGVFGAVLAKRGSSTTNYQLLVRNTNVLSFYQGSTVINDTTALSANTWYHIAVVATSGSTDFYINGSLSSSQSGTTITTSTDDLYIGQVLSGSYWDGYMDEISIFDRALNSTEIGSIYNNKQYVSPVALYRLENDVTDSVGSNDGTNNGVIFSPSVKPY
jgi:hypothetical protein